MYTIENIFIKMGLADGPQTIHNWSAGFPFAHALWIDPFGVHLRVVQRLRTGQFLWGSGVLYYTSR